MSTDILHRIYTEEYRKTKGYGVFLAEGASKCCSLLVATFADGSGVAGWLGCAGGRQLVRAPVV